MSGAQSWSVKGIDPKVREAAREAAARQGMSLGEYLSHALLNHQTGAPITGGASAVPASTRPRRVIGASAFDETEEDDWAISGPALMPRGADPARLAQRIETIERRTQLAVTGLDRAVSTIDRSVLGLAARIEDAEAMSADAAERMAEAIEQFRIAGETLSGRLAHAEEEAQSNRDALDGARSELSSAKERLESQVSLADEVARRAEARMTEKIQKTIDPAGGTHDKPTVEIDLGEYKITSHQSESNITVRIDFKLFGVVLEEEQQLMAKLFERHQHRFRDQVIFEVRNASLNDLADPGLGLIKRRILEKSNRLLGKSVLQSIVFSDFSFVEQ